MSLEGLTVLLVEDDILIQMDLQMTLEDAGASVVTASTVAEGLSMAEGAYTAAVLDIRLPDGEVFPVARVLASRNTPLIFHSGNTETSQVGTLFPGSIALSKPVSDVILIETIRKLAPAA